LSDALKLRNNGEKGKIRFVPNYGGGLTFKKGLNLHEEDHFQRGKGVPFGEDVTFREPPQ